jgi:two-component system cell cycle sensor histidine kinase/response regulator CckA
VTDPATDPADDGADDGAATAAAWPAALFERAPVAIVRVDLDGRIVDGNDAFARLTGAERADLAGRRLARLVAPGDRDDLARQLSKLVLGTARRVRLDDIRLAAIAGTERQVAIVACPDEDDGDMAGLWLWVVADGGRSGSAAALAQAQKMQAVGQLAGGIAHDFNNLLTGMLGFCDLLLARHPPADPSHDDLQQIRANALRAGSLVRQLLAFSRRQALVPERLRVDAAIRELSAMLGRLLGPGIDLVVAGDAGDACVEVDPGQLDQVIINLAVNARDAMPGGGTLTIRTGEAGVARAVACGEEHMPPGRYVRIDVADTGVGIPKEIIGHIFEPFFTTKDAARDGGSGTGLGLATVFGIVRQTGGYVFVESALGEGSTFSLFLPAVAAPPPATAQAAGAAAAQAADTEAAQALDTAAQAAAHAAAPVVLLVDDEDPVRVFAARGLRRAGYRVLEAASGEQALDVLAAHPAAARLLLTDVVMPGMDGYTLAQLACRDDPGLKVVAMSGFQEDGGAAARGGARVARFLQKPFTLAELLAAVAAAVAAGGPGTGPAPADPAAGTAAGGEG